MILPFTVALTLITSTQRDTSARPVQNTIDNEIIHKKVDVDAAFPGGPEKWKEYQDYRMHQDVINNAKLKPGIYTVALQFIVDKYGAISEVRPLTTFGQGLEDEAVRLLKSGPKWIPAKVNTRFVNAYQKNFVKFYVDVIPEGTSILSRGKTLYIDVDNPITIQSTDTKSSGLAVSLSNGEIVRNGNDYVARVKSPGKSTLHVWTTIGGKKKILASRDFEIAHLPDAVIRECGGCEPGMKIYVAELKKVNKARDLIDVDTNAKLVSYTFTIDLPNGSLFESKNIGEDINNATKDQLSQATGGQMITIDNIRIFFEGKERKIPSLVYHVVVSK